MHGTARTAHTIVRSGRDWKMLSGIFTRNSSTPREEVVWKCCTTEMTVLADTTTQMDGANGAGPLCPNPGRAWVGRTRFMNHEQGR